MKKHLSLLNVIFVTQLTVVFLVGVGILPRSLVIPLTMIIAFYVLFDSTENSSIFFVRSIPFFIAIPFTSYFDSFNIWRIASGLIFLKWFFGNKMSAIIFSSIKSLSRAPIKYFKENPVTTSVGIFFITSLFSLLVAEDLFPGIKRIIYFTNLSLIGFVIYDNAKKSEAFSKRMVKNLLVPGILVTIIGFAQLVSVYILTIDKFIDFWGEIVQRSWYGSDWANIVINSNTWFAYFGSQLSLRMFSILPDSHTFPMFLLLSIPSLLAISLLKTVNLSRSWKKMLQARASSWIAILPLMYLAAILSGTRGIWLAILGPILLTPFIIKRAGTRKNKTMILYISSFFVIFFILFLIANPILTSDQFKLEKAGSELLTKRIKSILDLEETSNSGRIFIWKESIGSILRNPILGVGIGNFPTILKQHTSLAKAGSSAHNLYLNIAAEIGLLGLLSALLFLWILLKRTLYYFLNSESDFLKIYSYSAILYIVWVLFYSLTDAALFDERVFLLFLAHSALLFGLAIGTKNKISHG